MSLISVELEVGNLISKHRGLAWGWLVVNPIGITKPTVGWKRAPLSVVASCLVDIISVLYLVFRTEYHECMLVFICP